MHLKSLTLKGFKSFASATTLKFEPGICAVVGPNGSGKSNVVDALAWVMGEQGAKTLRGGSMQDVIFAGAGDRKPLGRAEVTLTIDNSDGKLPIEYSEVSVTRRMFRDGASEYEINGSKARLMDIQELLSDSGIGREMHVIVGQGKLAEILDSRPEERRAFIEEAAGVLKHRRRKEKAQRKLTGMQTNLDRLRDLTDELGKQLSPLARQAEAAQKAATLQADVRHARLSLAGEQVTRLRAAVAHAQTAYEQQAAKQREVAEKVAELTEQHNKAERRRQELEPDVEAAQNVWFGLSTLAERVAATRRIASERADNAAAVARYSGPDIEVLEDRAQEAAEAAEEAEEALEMARERAESVREEREAREEAAREAEQEHTAAVQAIADQRAGIARLMSQRDALEDKVATATAEMQRQSAEAAAAMERAQEARTTAQAAADTIQELTADREPTVAADENARGELAQAEQRVGQVREEQRTLEKAVFALEAKISALEQSMPKDSARDRLGDDAQPVAELLGAPPHLGTALAAALGIFASGVALHADPTAVVKDLEQAARTVVYTRARSDHFDSWRLDGSVPADCSWLLDDVTVDSSVAPALTRLLADVIVAPTVERAVEVVAADPRLRAVTPSGELIGDGWIIAGHGQQTAVEVGGQIEEARAQLEAAQRAVDDIAGTVTGAEQAAHDARVHAASTAAAVSEIDATLDSWRREADRATKAAEAADATLRRAEVAANAAQERLENTHVELESIEQRIAHVNVDDVQSEPSTANRDHTRAAVEQVRAMDMEAQLAVRSAEEAQRQARDRVGALTRQIAHEKQARARHEQAAARQREEAARAEKVSHLAAQLADRCSLALEKAGVRREALTAEHAAVRAEASRLGTELNAARSHSDQAGKATHAAEIELSQAQTRADEVEKKVAEQLGIAVSDLIEHHSPGPDFDRKAATAELRKLEKALSSLGKVNPLALEEFKALEERYEFLSTQLADVEQAREDLTGVIKDVDAHILQLFTDAWKDVEAEFPRVFSTLFPGGEGRLLLTDPGDMLTTGIELEARPPGKRVKRLSLLSGGEKSLTALAMLVAIFRARPSPFYVMDEVEAALDDVNLRRLINLFQELRKDSQLIVITHQKPTMDIANVLYGVTMRGDGVTHVISQRMSPDVVAEEPEHRVSE
ncbi:chromosome segregation protein SMC [Corynebacterium renale]|uniref:Chromosome partition protein Smc n=1 Tax=Corynebacterium renale TaxID=1724 RepID=A0A2A9DPF0_9CORY|nr:chromosome segregation protein SMC [Corynebacterium renale]PFG28474.1 condensin subunit Smc [Corynebacterium renale]SQI26346.1 chromosome segregation protein [Corynebacterium renale]